MFRRACARIGRRITAGGYVLLSVLAWWVAGTTLGFAAPFDPAREWLRERLEEATTPLYVEGNPIAARGLLQAIYRSRDYEPLWTREDSLQQLLTAVRTADQHGLEPQDYHLLALEELLSSEEAPTRRFDERAALDLLLTDALVRLVYHLYFGKVDPQTLEPSWQFTRNLANFDPVQRVTEAVGEATVFRLFQAVTPAQLFYRRLQRALAEHRRIQAMGGWPRIPAGPTLEPGMREPRIATLRQRLIRSGDLPAESAADPNLYDAALEKAVQHFQHRHGLQTDGRVGPQTLASLNVPVEARIETLRVNLERARWVLHDLPPEFLIVDIAGFEAAYLRDRKVVWSSRAVVGQPYRKTPVFRSKITHLVLNPSWTIPPTILRDDVLPAVQRDPSYLRQRRITVLDANGRMVDPATVDWRRYRGPDFPYSLRQEPGPDNALGRIKFMFPNPYFVYLHDTPSRDLFREPARAFSSGCIRIERPFELAALLLQDERRWTVAQLQAAADTGMTRTLRVPQPPPVLLLYWTAVVDDQGLVHFRHDLYERDPAVAQALNKETVLTHLPSSLPADTP